MADRIHHAGAEEVEQQQEPEKNSGGSSEDKSDRAIDDEALPTRVKTKLFARVNTNETDKQSFTTGVKRRWAKLGLDSRTVKTMAKGALAPTISLAAYQATPFADTYTTLGYLVAIVSILSFPVMPRAKFIQNFINLVLIILLASCIALLAIFCCVQARIHTTATNISGTGGSGTSGTPSPGAQTAEYNPSACAVAAIWLFFEVWLINAMRARNPAITIPAIVAAIFANVSMVYAPQFSTMTQGISFVLRLMEAFLTGAAIGAGVSFFIFPLSMREVVSKEMAGYIGSLRGVMAANMAYMTSLQKEDMFKRTPTGRTETPRAPQAQSIKDALMAVSALHGKLSVDVPLAKREIAIGKLGPDDFQEIFRRLRALLQPVVGLSSLTDVFERITEEYGWQDFHDSRPLDEIDDDNERLRAESIEQWHKLFSFVNAPFSKMIGTIDQGFEHILLTMELIPRPKSKQIDAENKGDSPPAPGSEEFTKWLDQQVANFRANKANLLQKWADFSGIDLPEGFFERSRKAPLEPPEWNDPGVNDTARRKRIRRQWFLLLHVDFLIESTGKQVLDLCRYADHLGTTKLKRKRLVVPGSKRLRKWLKESMTSKRDNYEDEQRGLNDDPANTTSVYLGDAYHKRKNPEHLPPTNAIERFGDKLRAFPRFLRSPTSVFGFRVALATMCLAVVSYLRDTQQFYVTQRLFWSQIIVQISMSPSAGQSVFGCALRLGGTVVAMISSFIIWYIVNGHTAGVLVFFCFFVSWAFYVILKFPKFVPVGMLYAVTNALIIGYELQANKIGIALTESNGQAYYPLYELAPYRLATVAAGVFIAWIWTVFPYAISEHSELRRDVGSALYLLANYYSVVDETIRVRISREHNRSELESPISQLDKQRLKVYSKSLLLLQGLRTHAAFVRYDVPIGGRFPAATYNRIINRIQSTLNFTSLISFASQTFGEMTDDDDAENGSEWLRDFRRLSTEADVTSREITTLLSLLSASVSAGQPLPPYIKPPQPYTLATKLAALDENILSVRHLIEPGYSAFACMQIATRCVNDDLAALLRDIKQLVGELDFSFHYMSTSDNSAGTSRSDLAGKGKAD